VQAHLHLVDEVGFHSAEGDKRAPWSPRQK
jgi:hypothetical protein